MWQTRGLVGRAPLPSARFRISLNNAQKIRRTRGTPGSFHICKCSSPQLSPSPVASSPINDNDNEDPGADATTPQTTALPTATEPGDIAANAAAEVNTVDREIVDEEDITEAVTSSKQRGTQAASQNQSVDPQDNVLSVGFGERVILLDKSKVMALGKKALFVFLGVTFSIAMFRTLLKYMSPKATRVRTVGKNREVVEELMKYLPNNRDALSGQVLWMLRLKTGFTSIEVFRKYLWFTLREKEFGQEAVDDLVYLKTALGMNEHEIGEALKERAERIYDKYGTLMLNTVGMSSSGIERKATCKALFSKMLYLTEYEPLLGADSEALEKVDLREIFGATEADVDRLRIPSIQDLDWNKLDEMASEDTDKPTVAND